jgi:hypothetical protein
VAYVPQTTLVAEPGTMLDPPERAEIGWGRLRKAFKAVVTEEIPPVKTKGNFRNCSRLKDVNLFIRRDCLNETLPRVKSDRAIV